MSLRLMAWLASLPILSREAGAVVPCTHVEKETVSQAVGRFLAIPQGMSRSYYTREHR